MQFNDPSNAAQNGDEQILQGLVAAKARRRQKEASAELEQRQESPTGRATQYDTTTGDWLVQLPSGGTVRAQLNSNGAPIGRVPVQRNRDSQISSISAPPTNSDFASLIEQIDILSRTLVEMMAANIEAGDPNNETTPGVLDIPPRYPNDLYYDRDSGTLFRWNADLLNDPSNPLWEPLFQLWQGFTGVPAATVFVDGAIAINSSGELYTGDVSENEWAQLSGGGVVSLTTDPNSAGTPVQDNLLVINKVNGDQYYADNSSPQAWAKQPSGGGIGHYFSSDYPDNEIDADQLAIGSFFTNEGSGFLYYLTSDGWVQYKWKNCSDECQDPDPPPHYPGETCEYDYYGFGFNAPGPDYPCGGGAVSFRCTPSGWGWKCGN